MTKKITVQEEGVTISEGVRVLNFIGAGATAVGDGSVADITIPGGGGGTLTTQDEGATQSTTVTTLNVTGAGATISGAGATATLNIPGGGGGGNNLIPTDIVDPAAAPYVVQSGTLALLFFSSTDSTVTFANGVADGDRIGVVGYYGGGSTPGKINIDRGSNISSSCWNPSNKWLQYASGEFKALTFVWSTINSFWVLESASVFTTP